MAKMRKKSHERKTQCCSRVRSQQKRVGGTGRVDGDMLWEELAEVELDNGPGLLEVGACNFYWNNSLFFPSFLLTSESDHPFFSPWWKDKRVLMYTYHLPRCQGLSPAYGPYATAFLTIRFKQVWPLSNQWLWMRAALFPPLSSPIPSPSSLKFPVVAETFPVAGPAQM